MGGMVRVGRRVLATGSHHSRQCRPKLIPGVLLIAVDAASSGNACDTTRLAEICGMHCVDAKCGLTKPSTAFQPPSCNVQAVLEYQSCGPLSASDQERKSAVGFAERLQNEK